MLPNAAYLLDDTREAGFAATAAAVAEQHRNIRLEMTGPWPPYSFATAE
jgi:Gas vesicle synthesis protein GvpL/GvpF